MKMHDYRFGNRLRELREKCGMSQYQVGQLVGVTNRAVSKWETGAAKPKTALLLRLAEVLHVPLETLLSGSPELDDEPPEEPALKKDLWEQMYIRMKETYHTYFCYQIENRLQSEKRWAMTSDVLRRLQCLAEFVRLSNEQGEYVREQSGLYSFFTANSMGITDINPLPPHYHCPACGWIEFTKEDCPWDLPEKICRCGQKYNREGHRILYDLYWQNAAFHPAFRVRPQFMDEAEELLKIAFSEYNVCMVEQKKEQQRTYLLIPDDEPVHLPDPVPQEYLQGTIMRYGKVSLIAYRNLQGVYELEQMTNTSVRRIDYTSEKILQTCLLRTEQEIPENYRKKLEPFLKKFQPETMADCIKIMGLLHTPREWHEQCLFLRENYGLTLKEIPVFREDIFEHIRTGLFSVGETESGLAVCITDKILRGTYRNQAVNRVAEGNLRSMGTEPWFRDVLPHIPWLFPKALGLMTMQEHMWYIWYTQNMPEALLRIEGQKY
ncbi:MAG: helix-turn-helix domain-containing protein [Clostridia bacterium]|nr:helix-turn-helix domain-containing protein [Clostridia bacterium]